MSTNSINAALLTKMFLAGAANLQANKAWINELNVFPVPDGDTGTNMTMTVVSAVREVDGLGQTEDMKAICKAISSGSLRGARGNSGVILSQLLRGFCKIVRDHSQIDVPMVADAFDKAVETAYKAVMKPKEGTILTVARGAALKSRELADNGVEDFETFIPEVIQYAESILASTPDMLPVLKQAGVVDSGGQGLVQVMKGIYEGFQGKTVLAQDILDTHEEEGHEDDPVAEMKAKAAADLKFCYNTEYVIMLDKTFTPKMEKDFRSYLESIGDHLVYLNEVTDVRINLYTNDPGLVLQRSMMYGQLGNIRIENMHFTGQELPKAHIDVSETQTQDASGAPAADAAKESPHKDMGIIAVAAGDGIADILRGLGVDYVISGGQTMNPSTEDILNAVDQVNADTVFVLPNNKNIILASNQAANMTEKKEIIVIPTKNVPQGITAVINFMPDQDAQANRDNMTEEISKVSSAEITYAVRDTVIDDVEIREGNMMAIGDSGILSVGEDMNETAFQALTKMVTPTTELISIYYGQDTSMEDAEHLREHAAEAFPGCEVELQDGGQPIYYYLLSAE